MDRQTNMTDNTKEAKKGGTMLSYQRDLKHTTPIYTITGVLSILTSEEREMTRACSGARYCWVLSAPSGKQVRNWQHQWHRHQESGKMQTAA